ncbi:hypothetical protein NE237_032255 [Protea cynaroides]|uniref:Uncharacterized protein n=1 Tax=Protea cynaroides TaxID=273540 RepID=A0A9Q0R2X6_9MAGN|nr:hypothetical protein NE237_032255 [Protea cynaroides]
MRLRVYPKFALEIQSFVGFAVGVCGVAGDARGSAETCVAMLHAVSHEIEDGIKAHEQRVASHVGGRNYREKSLWVFDDIGDPEDGGLARARSRFSVEDLLTTMVFMADVLSSEGGTPEAMFDLLSDVPVIPCDDAMKMHISVLLGVRPDSCGVLVGAAIMSLVMADGSLTSVARFGSGSRGSNRREGEPTLGYLCQLCSDMIRHSAIIACALDTPQAVGEEDDEIKTLFDAGDLLSPMDISSNQIPRAMQWIVNEVAEGTCETLKDCDGQLICISGKCDDDPTVGTHVYSDASSIAGGCNSSGTLICGGKSYFTYDCSPPITSSMVAHLSPNDFSEASGSEESACDGKYHKNTELNVFVSTGCCDNEGDVEAPCANDIISGSDAVWEALGLNATDGVVEVTWTLADRVMSYVCILTS